MTTEPRALVFQGTSNAVAFVCPTCRAIHTVGKAGETAAREEARNCCAPVFCECGKERSRGLICCQECSEAKRIASARKVPAAEYEPEVVFVDGGVLPVGEAEVLLAPPFDDVPAWGVTVRRFKLDAEEIVEGELEHHHEDAWDELAPGAVEALQKALDAWIADYASRVTTYEQDESTIVVFGEEAKGEA